MKRERYWGLYDTATHAWLTKSHNWETGKGVKRMRFERVSDAKNAAALKVSAVIPRPFYVARKPRPVPAEALAVINAVRRWDGGSCGWTDVKKALEKYEESK
jgi:hypothetical protein